MKNTLYRKMKKQLYLTQKEWNRMEEMAERYELTTGELLRQLLKEEYQKINQ